MITIEQLKKFCSTDETRPHPMEPFNYKMNAIATDGRILIGVPRIEGLREWDESFVKSLPETLKLYPQDAVTWFPLPEIPKATECTRCMGSGKGECPHCFSEIDCEECKGYGDVFEVESIPVGKRLLNPRYLAMIAELPDVSIAIHHLEEPDEDGLDRAISFRFTVGFGLLMPMRK